MSRYIVSKTITPTAGNDLITLKANSNRMRLVQVTVSGAGTTSAAQAVYVVRAGTVGVTPGGAITAGKFDSTDQPAATGLAYTTWATQPVIATDNQENLTWNALGGANRWIPPGGEGFEIRGSEELCFRAKTGVTFQAAEITVIWDED